MEPENLRDLTNNTGADVLEVGIFNFFCSSRVDYYYFFKAGRHYCFEVFELYCGERRLVIKNNVYVLR